MREKHIAHIMDFISSQDESRIKSLAEAADFLDENKLIYILTFINKMFGGH